MACAAVLLQLLVGLQLIQLQVLEHTIIVLQLVGHRTVMQSMLLSSLALQGQPETTASTPAQLLGIVRVPLQPPQQQQQLEPQSHLNTQDISEAASSDMQQLVEGSYPVYDVLQGKAVGTLELSVHLLQTPSTPPAAAVGGGEGNPQATVTQQPVTAETEAAAAADDVGVRHVIDVTLVNASGLPDASDLSAAQQPVPGKRFVKYSFPGEIKHIITSWLGTSAKY